MEMTVEVGHKHCIRLDFVLCSQPDMNANKTGNSFTLLFRGDTDWCVYLKQASTEKRHMLLLEDKAKQSRTFSQSFSQG